METTASIRVSASERLHAAFAAVRELDLPDRTSQPCCAPALDVAEIVRTLDADDDVVIAAMLQPSARRQTPGSGSRREALRRRCAAAGARIEPIGRVRLAGRLDSRAGARGRSGRGAAQDAAGRDRRRAPGGGAAGRAIAEDARRQVARSRAGSAKSRPKPAKSTRRSPIDWACGS